LNDLVLDVGVTRPKNAKLWERDPHDWYVEPTWVPERFFAVERFEGEIFDPSCGMGRIVEAARAAGYNHVRGHDLIARFPVVERAEDFFASDEEVDNIVTNPPFKLCNDAPYSYVEHALKRSRRKTALIMQASWVFGQDRSYWLESKHPYRIYHITPKPSMPPGSVILAGHKPNSGQTDYVIVVFLRGYEGPWTTHFIRRDPPKVKR
jgi:hypothetical protein